MFKRMSVLSVLAVPAVALLAAGCGSSSDSTATAASASTSAASAGRGKVLKLSADPGGQLRFTKSKLTLSKPGKVTLVMTNPKSAGMPHGIAIEGKGVDKDGPVVRAGRTSRLTVTLKKGKYTYYCPVPGHEQAGMKGTLTVK